MTTSAKQSRTGPSFVVDGCLLFGLSALLVWPLFTVEYIDNWASIESTFIADARFLKEHWPHPQWQPLWYGGTRFDYIYPPALRYGAAAISMLLSISTAHAYHLFTATLYCLGIAGVYLLVRTLSGSRRMAWIAAAGTALVSPSYLLLRDVWAVAAGHFLTPWRLHVLEQWGEGPHISALSLVGPALAAVFWAIKSRNRAGLAVASLLCALVVSHNFYGGVALTLLFGTMLWSWWVTHQDHSVWLRGLAIGGLAYALSAFWLVPSYVRLTLANLSVIGADNDPSHFMLLVGVGLAFLALSYRSAKGRPERFYPVFVLGALCVFGTIILGDHWLGIKAVGSPGRLIPEFDLALILTALEILRRWWNRAGNRLPGAALILRLGLILLALVPSCSSREYVMNAWRIYPNDPHYEQRIEYRISDWMAANLPGMRSYVAGSVRFWYNAWHDLAHLSGGSEQGILNQDLLQATGSVRWGEDGEEAIRWMKCFGVDAIVVSDETSQEVYDDYSFPRKFAGRLPVLYDEGEGDVIYQVPRRYPGLARVVKKADALRLKAVREGWEPEHLQAYVDVVERGPASQATMAWEGTDALRIRANFGYDEALLIQVAYDPAWVALAGARRLSIDRDALGQMLIDVPEGPQEVLVFFDLPLENAVGRMISVAGGIIFIFLVVTGFRRRPTERE